MLEKRRNHKLDHELARGGGGGGDGAKNIIQIYHLLNVIGVKKGNFCVESPSPTTRESHGLLVK